MVHWRKSNATRGFRKEKEVMAGYRNNGHTVKKGHTGYDFTAQKGSGPKRYVEVKSGEGRLTPDQLAAQHRHGSNYVVRRVPSKWNP